MKKFLLLFVVAALCWSCDGLIGGGWYSDPIYDFEVDGIYYNYLEGTNVEVACPYFSNAGLHSDYEGDVVVPSTVNYNDTIYQVVKIGERAFTQCHKLNSVTISEGITEIGTFAFDYCRALTSVSLPNSLTTIQGYAFIGCGKLANVNLPANLETIGTAAFDMSTAFTHLVIPKSVTSIGGMAFGYCPMESIIVEEGNTVYHSAGNCLIHTESKTLHTGCNKSIIPDDGSVTTIGADCMAGCNGLTTIVIPDSIKRIEFYAFGECKNLRTIVIPNGVEYVDNAFYYCDNLQFNVYDNVNYLGNEENPYLVCVGAVDREIRSCSIREEARFVVSSAFYACENIRSIVVPDNVVMIGDYAFYLMEDLKSIKIGESVKTIGENAFLWSSTLESITLPASVIKIGQDAFKGCSGLKFIKSLNPIPPTIYDGTFLPVYISSDKPVYVPAESVEAYKNAPHWKNFTNIRAIE